MRVANKGNKPTQNNPAIEKYAKSLSSEGTRNDHNEHVICEPKDIISFVFAPTLETTLQSVPDIQNIGTQFKESPECAPGISFLDSAYSSCPSGSQPATLPFQTQECTDKKIADGLCDHLMFKDGGLDGDVLHELSFEEFCNLDDQDFSMWANPDYAE